MLSQLKIKEVQDRLSEILPPILLDIVKSIEKEPGSDNPYFIEIPHAEHVDLSVEDLLSLVARTSNRYQVAARAAGAARAEFKQAEARYKLKYKRNLHGKNPGEREANALGAAEDEFVALSLVESIVALAEAQEMASKVAHDAAKKILDKVEAMSVASSRDKGQYRESDFREGW